ncbi:MAG: FliH/SctL family protein [Pseudorhodoplanes sp.]
MNAPAKFLFDVDFAAASRTPKPIPVAEHENRLAEAEAEGYRKGYSAAEQQAAADNARHSALALAQIGAALNEMTQRLKGVEARLEAEAVEVAVAVARKLAPALIAREPFAEIAALAAECFRNLTATPHVAVRVNEAIYPVARDKLGAVAGESGFEGRLVVLAEPDMQPGDCRIEWADGGAKRDRLAIETAINESVGRYVTARRADAI